MNLFAARRTVFVVWLFFGCGADADTSVDASTNTCPTGQVWCDGCIEAIAPTAEAIQQRIFSRSCALSTSCHRGGAAPEGLTLASVDDVFTHAVSIQSKQTPTLALIAPGKPTESYLLDKLRGMRLAARASAGEPSTAMPPPPSAALCEAKIQAIEAWISAGALR